MVKVVYNACFGGFGLSEAGVRRYAEIKGFSVYPDVEDILMTTYWTVPPTERPSRGGWQDKTATAEERKAYNAAYSEHTFCENDLSRTDLVLVQVVQELGRAASGRSADLRVQYVPEGVRYRIDEYDGNESVMTVDDYEWQVG